MYIQWIKNKINVIIKKAYIFMYNMHTIKNPTQAKPVRGQTFNIYLHTIQ